MNSKELEENYKRNKDKFHKYIINIKKNMKVDIYSIINPTMISNPYTTKFPLNFFLNQEVEKTNKVILFIKNSLKFYLKQFYHLFSYLISFILYKIYYKKQSNITSKTIGIDIFFLVDNIIKDNKFSENYFQGLYDVLDKYNQDYVFLPRLYGIGKNPFKLIQLFKILNNDKRKFLFEFELLSILDFIKIFSMIVVYPFKTLRLKQNNILFDNELINDISNIGFDPFSRYIYGKNIVKQNILKKIYSWSEFQVIERSFNYGIRTNSNDIKLIACLFYLNYETYFNAYIDDIDYKLLLSAHKVLVNGKYYVLDSDKIKYDTGVSLRYKNIFKFKKDNNIIDNKVLLLGSYIQNDTKYMLDSVKDLENILFKNHPAVDIKVFDKIDNSIEIVTNNIYELFQKSNIVIGTASGTSVEAVVCGISVIIIASQDNLTANPLVEYGKGKIWDIAFSKDDVKILYNKLIEYRQNHQEKIKQIASWYKDNFFIEPTEENIIKVFELDKE